MSPIKIEFFRVETSAMFDQLAEYREKMEIQLGIIQQNEEEQLHSQAEAEDWEPDEFFAMQDIIHRSYDFIFTRYLRYSFIVLLFLILENRLNQLCDEVKNRHDLPVGASEFKGV